MGMELSVQPIASPDTQIWPVENGFSLPTGPVKMETKLEETSPSDIPLEKIPTTFLQRYNNYQAHTASTNGLHPQQQNSQINPMRSHLSSLNDSTRRMQDLPLQGDKRSPADLASRLKNLRRPRKVNSTRSIRKRASLECQEF